MPNVYFEKIIMGYWYTKKRYISRHIMIYGNSYVSTIFIGT